MHTTTCTIEELKPDLKNVLRAPSQQFSLEDIESDVLMCCETQAILQKSGLFGTKEPSLSAAYLTPKGLVWAVAENGSVASAGSTQLRDYESTAMFAMVPSQGLDITGRYTDVHRTGITFISPGLGQMVRISATS